MARSVEKSVLSKWQDEGLGARVRRSIGRPEVITICTYNNMHFISPPFN